MIIMHVGSGNIGLLRLLNRRLFGIYMFICCSAVAFETVAGSLTVEQLSYCSVKTNEGVIDLKSLGRDGKPRLTAVFGEPGKMWNYSYNPCYEFDMPANPKEGFGDKCLSASLCKYGQQGHRTYYYTLGFQQQAKFLVTRGKNNITEVRLKFVAYSSLEGKTTYIRLVCNKSLTTPDQAIFKVIRDQKGLGDIEAELHHVCSCVNGCHDAVANVSVPQCDTVMVDVVTMVNVTFPNTCNRWLDETCDYICPADYAPTGQNLNMKCIIDGWDRRNEHLCEVLTDDQFKMPDRKKVIIIVGVNMGVILFSVILGFLCYNKKAHLEIYKKLPGILSTPEPNTWQLSSINDLERPHDLVQQTTGTGSPANTKPMTNGVSKAGYRDYEPKASRRKSLHFPVLEHCNIPEECISLGQRLGGNLFGDTYIGEWTGIKVAIKRITLSVHENQMNVDNIKWLQDEILFLSRQRHRNIVSLLGLCSETKHPYIISEYAIGQCVKDFIKQPGNVITWTHRVKILSQVADGMAFLHSTSPPLLHRDLRCANMFVNNNDVTKVADFGIVKLTQPLRQFCQIDDCCCQGQYSACPFSIGWTAPEVLEHPNSQETEGYITAACDVYSYAVVMWELVMCEDPYDDMATAQEVIEHVISGGRPDLSCSRNMLKPYRELMTMCWSTNAVDRPIFKKITVHLKEIMHQARVFQKAVGNGHTSSTQGLSKAGSNSTELA